MEVSSTPKDTAQNGFNEEKIKDPLAWITVTDNRFMDSEHVTCWSQLTFYL